MSNPIIIGIDHGYAAMKTAHCSFPTGLVAYTHEPYSSDHVLEYDGQFYVTGGRVLVLGPTGKNFAAGMSGGVAYVLDEDSKLYKNLNKEMVSVETVTSKYDVIELKDMLKEHVAYTNSEKGKEILKDFEQYLPKFKKIMPNDYKAMLNLIVQMEERGLSSEQAKMEAFNIKANAGK